MSINTLCLYFLHLFECFLIEGDEALGDGTKVHTWAWAYTKCPQNNDLTLYNYVPSGAP